MKSVGCIVVNGNLILVYEFRMMRMEGVVSYFKVLF